LYFSAHVDCASERFFSWVSDCASEGDRRGLGGTGAGPGVVVIIRAFALALPARLRWSMARGDMFLGLPLLRLPKADMTREISPLVGCLFFIGVV
jgi:hypothetical protein